MICPKKATTTATTNRTRPTGAGFSHGNVTEATSANWTVRPITEVGRVPLTSYRRHRQPGEARPTHHHPPTLKPFTMAADRPGDQAAYPAVVVGDEWPASSWVSRRSRDDRYTFVRNQCRAV